ncbi:MAG: DNA/RNA non-specific endonuclease [Bacteriovorax sp.]|nr:DNA/RNA non-specific endonuclease [Bacteriovorax sp.]
MKSAKNKIFFSIFLLFTLSFNNLALAKIEIVLGSTPLDGNPNLAQKVPVNEASEIIISRDQYVISYNKLRRSPNWTAWKLELDQIGNSGRSNNFLQDIDLENYLNQSPQNLHAVDPTEYKGSCFDRGHQIPSADRTDSKENNQTTFFMSNMIPQTPNLNRVSWEHLEQYTRDLVQKQGKKAYIIAGPIYDQDFGLIGPNKDIPIPSKDFKVIIILDANQTPADINNDTPIISVIMPNTLQDGSKPLSDMNQLCKPLSPGPLDRNDWVKYKTTLSEVETLSGFKILSVKAKI